MVGVRAVVGVEMRETLVNGLWPLKLPSSRAAQWSAWMADRGGWELERLNSMEALIRPGMIVHEIGSEEGDISALCARWSERVITGYSTGPPQRAVWHEVPQGGVVLFEPDARVWPNIRAIFEANHLSTPLASVVGFAGDVDRKVGVETTWPACASGPIIDDHGFCHLSERPDIPAVRIDTVAETYPPDAITIDVEGSELRVILGAQQTLREHRPIVWISVHPDFMRDLYGDSPQDLHAVMVDCGYEAYHLATDHEQHWLYKPKGAADAAP